MVSLASVVLAMIQAEISHAMREERVRVLEVEGVGVGAGKGTRYNDCVRCFALIFYCGELIM